MQKRQIESRYIRNEQLQELYLIAIFDGSDVHLFPMPMWREIQGDYFTLHLAVW